jgi:hypothetical protein
METGAPRMYATANDVPVVSGTRFQPGTPGDSIAFVVDLVDESRIDDLDAHDHGRRRPAGRSLGVVDHAELPGHAQRRRRPALPA